MNTMTRRQETNWEATAIVQVREVSQGLPYWSSS